MSRTLIRHAALLLASTLALVTVTGVVYGLRPYAPVVSLGSLYVFAVLPVAVFGGLVYALPVAVASGLVFNFFFLPPLHTLRLQDSENWIAITVYVVTALVVSGLAARMRQRAAEAEEREREAALLAEIGELLLEGGEVQGRLREVGAAVGRALASRRASIELGSLRRPGPGESAHDLTVGGQHVGRLYLDKDVRLAATVNARLLPGIASMLAVAREREQLARTALEAETLRRSDEIKTAVLRAVSHDLRSPLTAIRAARDGLENPSLSLSDADRAELHATMRAETDRLDRLVANLLALSRLESGAASPRPELWTVDALIGRALSTLGVAAERVEVVLAGELPAVRVDAAQLERVLANLLENALAVSPRCLVGAEPMLDELVVRISDEGPGLDPADLERIFLPFERGAGSRRGGSGLGLSIARGFVEANGGRVWAETQAGSGATFAVALPSAPVPAMASG